MKLVLSPPQSNTQSEIVIEPEAIKYLVDYAKSFSAVFMVADQTAYGHLKEYAAKFLPENIVVIEIDISEKVKDLSSVELILKELKANGCDRKGLVVGFGGGVLCDAVGYAASSYMRGVSWIAVPTTLIAQADAAIGGKTGVNLEEYKNLIGAFWQPKAVLIDPNMLQTLPKRHMRAGLAEIIKMGFIDNKEIISLLNDASNLDDILSRLIELSVEGKVNIVNKDPLESGERKLLNFGHTLGHAFESISLNESEHLLHGEAISVGMVAEAKLAELEGISEPGVSEQVREMLIKFSLPTTFYAQDRQAILQRINLDKKNLNGTVLWTLPKALGEGIYNHQALDDNVEKAIDFISA